MVQKRRKAKRVLYDTFDETGKHGIRIVAEEFCYRLEIDRHPPDYFEDLGILISHIPLERLRYSINNLTEIPQKLAEYKKEVENIAKEISAISQPLLQHINKGKKWS